MSNVRAVIINADYADMLEQVAARAGETAGETVQRLIVLEYIKCCCEVVLLHG